MSTPLRLALIAITLALLIMSLGRGTTEGRLLMASLFAPTVTDIQPLVLTRGARPAPARLIERVRADLSRPDANAPSAAPEIEGKPHLTLVGMRWWGHGPVEGDPRPAILLLHGEAQDGRDMIAMWQALAEQQDLVLIAPDFDLGEGATAPYDARLGMEAVAQAAQLYRVDESRIALFGHGTGAETAQIWANSVAGPWQAVAVHAGVVDFDVPRPVAEGVPVRHYFGSEDPTRPVAQALASATAMARAGHPYELIRLRGHDNRIERVGPRIAQDAWLWIEARIAPRLAP